MGKRRQTFIDGCLKLYKKLRNEGARRKKSIRLPAEILMEIFSFWNRKFIEQMKLVCRCFYDLISLYPLNTRPHLLIQKFGISQNVLFVKGVQLHNVLFKNLAQVMPPKYLRIKFVNFLSLPTDQQLFQDYQNFIQHIKFSWIECKHSHSHIELYKTSDLQIVNELLTSVALTKEIRLNFFIPMADSLSCGSILELPALQFANNLTIYSAYEGLQGIGKDEIVRWLHYPSGENSVKKLKIEVKTGMTSFLINQLKVSLLEGFDGDISQKQYTFLIFGVYEQDDFQKFANQIGECLTIEISGGSLQVHRMNKLLKS